MFRHSIPWHGDSLGALVLAGSIIRPSDCRTAKKYYKLLKLNPKSCLIHLVHGTVPPNIGIKIYYAGKRGAYDSTAVN